MEIIPTPIVVLLQLFPFGVTALALYYILFKPMLAYLDERAAAIEGERQKAAQLEARVVARLAEYEARLEKARAEVTELRTSRRAEAVEAYNALINEARHNAEAQVAAALVQLGAEREAARASLEQTANGLGAQIATRVLGRDVAVG